MGLIKLEFEGRFWSNNRKKNQNTTKLSRIKFYSHSEKEAFLNRQFLEIYLSHLKTGVEQGSTAAKDMAYFILSF